jgi:hypothetical protein
MTVKSTTVWALLAALALVCVVYLPGLSGPFVYDDWGNLSSNKRVQITDLSWASLTQAATSGQSGPLGRPVAMLSFGVNHAFSGLDPWAYKATNLAIHLVNTLLAFLLARTLSALLAPTETASRTVQVWIPLFAACWWGLSAMQITAVLYTVQRMTSLGATFVLLGLLAYSIGRLRIAKQHAGGPLLVASALLISLPLALLTKESAVMMLAYIVVLEWFALPSPASGCSRNAVAAWRWLLPLGGLAAAVWYATAHWPQIAEESQLRGFTPVQRLMTETRVVWWYLRLLLLPSPPEFGLIHDDWQLSQSLFEPASTVFAVLGITTLGAWCLWSVRRRNPVGFGLAWFLAGHVLESTIYPLLLVFEHRNYLPSFGLFVGLSIAGTAAARSLFADPATRPRLLAAIAFAVIGLNAAVTASRAFEWSSFQDLAVAHATRHPKSPSSQFLLGAFYATQVPRTTDPVRRLHFVMGAEDHFGRALASDPGMASAAIARLVMYARAGGTIPDEVVDTVIGALARGRMTPSTRSALMDITDCIIKRECSSDPAIVERIFDAALAHPDAHGRVKSDLLASLSEYAGVALGDLPSAMALAQAATDEPGAAFVTRFLPVRWLVAMGRLDEAETALHGLAQRDDSMSWRPTIDQWLRRVSELRQEIDVQDAIRSAPENPAGPQ